MVCCAKLRDRLRTSSPSRYHAIAALILGSMERAIGVGQQLLCAAVFAVSDIKAGGR